MCHLIYIQYLPSLYTLSLQSKLTLNWQTFKVLQIKFGVKRKIESINITKILQK